MTTASTSINSLHNTSQTNKTENGTKSIYFSEACTKQKGVALMRLHTLLSHFLGGLGTLSAGLDG